MTMDSSDSEKIGKLREAIELVEQSAITQLPFELFERRGNRTTKLIITSGEATPTGGKRRWFEFSLNELTLITSLTVELSGYSGFSEFDVRWIDEKGVQHEVSSYPEGDRIQVDINDICKSVSFRPPTVLFFSTYINRVIIEGIERSNFAKALQSLSKMESYREDVLEIVDKAVDKANTAIADSNRLAIERASIGREISQSKSSLARAKRAVEEASLKRAELIAQNAASETSINQLAADIRELTSQAEDIENKRNGLRSEILQAEGRLKELKENINIFPSEIVGFANQARRTGWQYFALSAVPILVMVVMFILLVKGAADLTTVLDEHPKSKIEDIMISRIPYVTIAIAIITACYKFARAFFLELIKINTQRLNLTKISIVARDVSFSSEHGLDLSQDEIYRLRSEMKMEMLRDHMKEYLSKDFKIHLPSRIIGSLPFGKKQIEVEVESLPTDGA